MSEEQMGLPPTCFLCDREASEENQIVLIQISRGWVAVHVGCYEESLKKARKQVEIAPV